MGLTPGFPFGCGGTGAHEAAVIRRRATRVTRACRQARARSTTPKLESPASTIAGSGSQRRSSRTQEAGRSGRGRCGLPSFALTAGDGDGMVRNGKAQGRLLQGRRMIAVQQSQRMPVVVAGWPDFERTASWSMPFCAPPSRHRPCSLSPLVSLYSRGLRASARPSPRRLMPSTARHTARPGKTISLHAWNMCS